MQAAVIGVGLIGGSLAAALRQGGHHVVGFDAQSSHLDAAQKLGLVDACAATVSDAVRDADVVVLAVPVLRIIDLLPEIEHWARPDALIVDVGSVKKPVVRVMERLRYPGRAIGGHPIAGNERSGPESASAGIVEGRVFALCPSNRTTDETRASIETLVREIGAVPMVVDAAIHDGILARTSHVPQLLSTALALCLEPDDVRLSGPGLRDMTRLAASAPGIWTEIAATNRPRILESMREFSHRFEDLMAMVERDDLGHLADAMQKGAAAAAPLREREP